MDPQHWSKDCCLVYNSKQTCIFFLLPTASSCLITSLSGWGGGGGCTWPGGGCTGGGEGGSTCILCIPPGYAPGCVPTIQAFIERNLYMVGGIAIAIALSQVSYRGDCSNRGLCTHHSGLHREEPLHGGGHRHSHRS